MRSPGVLRRHVSRQLRENALLQLPLKLVPPDPGIRLDFEVGPDDAFAF